MGSKGYVLERTSGMKVSDEDLLADLRRVAALDGAGTIGHKQYRERGRYDDSTITRRFGAWNAALAAAGLDLANEMDLPDERLFENIAELWAHYGRQPRKSELSRAPSRVSQSPYHRRFGSWGAALEWFVEAANESGGTAPGSSQAGPRKATPRDPSTRLRFRVLQRDRFSCRSCGASPALHPGLVLHVDHVLAWSEGGETELDNLQTLCARCNGGKGALPG